MKTTKRFVALLMAVVMTFALGAVALAESGVFSNLPGAGDGSYEPITGFNIPKGIYVKNNSLESVPLPEVTFNFKIEAVKEGDPALQYGAHAAGVQVYPGKAGALFGADKSELTSSKQIKTSAGGDGYGTDLTFYTRTVTGVNAEEGAHVEEPLYFGTSMTPFANETKPGVYRYRVTDITPAAYLESVGISRGSNYDTVAYVDLYVQIDYDGNGNTVPTIGSIVVSEVESKVPERNENGTINIVNTTDPTDKQELDPKNVVVTEDGTVWTLKTGASEPYVFPTSYEIKTGYKVPEDKMIPGLVKTKDVFNDKPEGKFEDTDYDGKPDDTNNDNVPDNLTGTEVKRDDEGNIIGLDGKPYPADEYIVDPATGEILHDSDGDGVKDDPVGPGADDHVYAGRIRLFEYDADVYETFNVCLKKLITGPMGDKTHEFPFVADVTNKTAQAGDDAQELEYKYQEGEGLVNTANGSTAQHSFKLKDEELFFIRGLNANALLNFTETNDTSFPFAVTVTGRDGYSYRSADAMNKGDQMSAYPGAQKVATAVDGVFAENPLQYTTMTNRQSNINPTGVVLRFAPYILMLGAACFFVALSRRRREQENA